MNSLLIMTMLWSENLKGKKLVFCCIVYHFLLDFPTNTSLPECSIWYAVLYAVSQPEFNASQCKMVSALHGVHSSAM